MKIDKKNRKNSIIYENAKNIIRNKYNDEIGLLPIIIKCSLHDAIMQTLSNSKMLNHMVFQGGTCLQRIYGSVRLSEDLDFCVQRDISELSEFKKFCKDFEEILRIDLLKLYEIDSNDIFFRQPKKDMSIAQEGDVFIWKIGLMIDLGEKRQIIKIDLENRKPLTTSIKIFDKLPGDQISTEELYVTVETAEEILVNKFISLYQRNRIQYRDFYDIAFLLRKCFNTINKDYLLAKIAQRFQDGSFIDKLENRKNLFDDMNIFSLNLRNELRGFIPSYLFEKTLSDQMINYTKEQILENIRLCNRYLK